MPRPSRRSRTLRRVYVKTIKHTKLSYAKRKPSKAHCADCRAVLHGVASKRPYKMSKLSKTEKRPERPYGGVLCASCTRKRIKSSL